MLRFFKTLFSLGMCCCTRKRHASILEGDRCRRGTVPSRSDGDVGSGLQLFRSSGHKLQQYLPWRYCGYNRERGPARYGEIHRLKILVLNPQEKLRSMLFQNGRRGLLLDVTFPTASLRSRFHSDVDSLTRKRYNICDIGKNRDYQWSLFVPNLDHETTNPKP